MNEAQWQPLTDEQWYILQPLVQEYDPQYFGRKRLDDRRALDTILYKEITGCAWNRLPKYFPDDSTVNRTYRRWKRLGLLEVLYETLINTSRLSA